MQRLSAEQSRLVTGSLVILAATAIATALVFTRVVMVPFVLAIMFTYLLAPLVDALQDRLRFPRAVAVALAIVIGIGLLTLLGLLITVSTSGLLQSADIYRERLAILAERVQVAAAGWGIPLDQQPLFDTLRRLPIGKLVQQAAGTVLGLVTNGVLVLIFLVYLLGTRRPPALRRGIYRDMDRAIQRYLVTKVSTSALTGVLVGLILSLFGLDLALVFGILAFFLNFIPSLGSIVATLLPIPVAIIQYETAWPVIGVVLLPALVQVTVGNGLEPILMGRRLDLHPVTILLALLFWGLIWGVVGMLLAAPMTAVLRIVLSQFETTRPVADLLAGRLPETLSATNPLSAAVPRPG